MEWLGQGKQHNQTQLHNQFTVMEVGEPEGGGAMTPPQCFADQFQPRGADSVHSLLPASPKFYEFCKNSHFLCF